MATDNRLISIDIARAICIILVVIGHYHPENSPLWYETVNRIIYSFHMPLFMFASGYVYWATRKAAGYKNFIRQKFKRLMIPYFFVSIIIIAIKLFTERGLSVENPVDISAFYQMFYSPSAAYFLWFVFALFLCFLIIPLFNTNKKLPVLLTAALVLHIVPLDFPKAFCLAEFKQNFLWFVSGCIMVEQVKVRQVINKIPVLAALLLFAGCFAVRDYAVFSAVKIIFSIILAGLGVIFISGFSKYIGDKTRLIKVALLNVSVFSYSIYLFHTTFEGFAKSIIIKFYPPHLTLLTLI